MANTQQVNVVLNAKDQASSVIKGFGSQIKGLIPILGVAGLAGAIAGVIKQTAAFESKLSDVSTLISGDSTQAINQFREGIQEMSRVIPKTPEELGAAAYQVVSAGITDTADALDVLKSSAILANAGLGTTEEATTLMVLAMNNFRDSGLEADKVANLMFKTIRGGITNVSEMSRSFGLVAPLAVDAGVSLEELQAATAALTQVNKSASISQNAIKAALVSLGKPTQEAIDLFDQLGVKTFKELVDRSGGMVQAFQALQDATNGDSQSFAKAIGSGEALSAVLSLLGAQSGSFNEALASMKSGTDDLTEANDKQNQTIEKQWQLLKNNLSVEAQKLAVATFPALIVVISFLSKSIQGLGMLFEDIGKGFKGLEMLATDVFTAMFEAADKVRNTIQAIIDLIKGASESVGNFVTESGGRYSTRGSRAGGGPVIGGSSYLVGETGPEIFTPGVSGAITNPMMAGGGGGIVINISGNTLLDGSAGDRLAMQIIRRLKENLRL